MRGRIAVAGLERVLPSLISDQGELQVELDFGKDQDGTYFLAGTIQGEIILCCQRCMEGLTLPLDIRFRLGLLRDGGQVDSLSDRFEPLVVTAEPAYIADIVSDEVLLALPIVPLHKDSDECHAYMKAYKPPQGEQRENPFAVLAGLKHKQ